MSSCDVCQRNNRKQITDVPELHPVPVKSPWHHIAIDFIGPINPVSTKGNKYILTISDYFTKFVNAIPLPDKLLLKSLKSFTIDAVIKKRIELLEIAKTIHDFYLFIMFFLVLSLQFFQNHFNKYIYYI